MVAHIFNPSTWGSYAFNPNSRELETRRDMVGQREEYKAGKNGSFEAFSLRTCKNRISLSVYGFVEVRISRAGRSTSLVVQLSPSNICLWVFIVKAN